MKNKKQQPNYLDMIPVRNPEIRWTTDKKGIVTLEIENKGLANRIAQKLSRKISVLYKNFSKNHFRKSAAVLQ